MVYCQYCLGPDAAVNCPRCSTHAIALRDLGTGKIGESIIVGSEAPLQSERGPLWVWLQETTQEREYAAKGPNTHPWLLDALADEFPTEVAGNPNAPLALLGTLLSRGYYYHVEQRRLFVEVIYKNLSLPIHALEDPGVTQDLLARCELILKESQEFRARPYPPDRPAIFNTDTQE